MNFLKEAIETDPFKDRFNISGFVVLEDKKNNKVLLKRHNLILKNAKKLILNKLLYNYSADTTYITNLIDLNIINDSKFKQDTTLRRIVFGYTENDVSYRDSINIFNNSNNKIIVKTLDSNNLELTTAEKYNDYYALVISADIKFSDFSGTAGGENYLINTLGLVMGSEETSKTNEFNTDDELFSRISFDPIVVSQDSDLKLTYYVYF